MNIKLFCENNVIKTIHSHNDHKGCVYWQVDGRTIGLQIGKEKTLKLFQKEIARIG